MMGTKKKRVFVTGDFVLDHHIYQGERYQFYDNAQGVNEVQELGGAALVFRILQKCHGVVEKQFALSADIEIANKSNSITKVPQECQAYAFWRPMKKVRGKAGLVWRVDESMGYGGQFSQKKTDRWPEHTIPRAKQDVIVISEGGLVFREKVPTQLNSLLNRAEWIVLKTCSPLMTGPLWKNLSKAELAKKLVVVVAASQLRKSAAQISQGLSWEESLETLAAGLLPGGALENLGRCRHLIVTFGSEGAIWIDRKWGKSGIQPIKRSQCHFIYQASAIEDSNQAKYEGSAFGFLSCLAASITHALAENGVAEFEEAIEGGLSAMHDLLESGHGDAGQNAKGFPAKRLAGVISSATCRFSRAAMPFSSLCGGVISKGITTCPDKSKSCWSLLREVRSANGYKCIEPADDLAKLVIKHGTIALESLPHLHMGALMSVDRHEIESMRILARTVADYKKRGKSNKPLSLGVFGPPGSGKSFAVKQIAQTLLGKAGWLEFNLSQFNGPTDLIGAFHQIRDKVLEGELPVAFFDEFDSQEYKWLQYLLAPMQDGCFQEGQITHPIGKCVFIFAGGTSPSFETFGPPEKPKKAYQEFRFKKGPDFQSRLDGFLNVNGPNRRSLPSSRDDATDPCDIFFPIRRAFIMRGEFRYASYANLVINEGLLDALVQTTKYKHGSRSLSKVLEPLKAALPGPLYRSLIPPHGQLALHTDADEFIKLSGNTKLAPPLPPSLSRSQEEIIAKGMHRTWEQLGIKNGWKTKEKLKKFSELSSFFKGSNRAAAQRMPEILALVGLKLESGKNTIKELHFTRNRIEYHLELLGAAEHDGWMEWHFSQGWKCGPEKDPAELTEEPKTKTHPCLLPYMELSDTDRNKDRNAIRHYPDFVAAAKMKIVPIDKDQES